MRVFLSYAVADSAFASELRRALSARGAEAFDPRLDVSSGEELSRHILDRLKRSDLVVFVVPRFEGEGKSALVELGAARAFGKRIVAVLPDALRARNSGVASALGDIYRLGAEGNNVDSLADRVLADQAAA